MMRAPGRRGGRRQRGFTLLEMMVVLIVMTLVGTLLIQGLMHYFKARERVAAALTRTHVTSIQQQWMRDLLGQIEPAASDKAWYFRGTQTSLAGVTLRSLDQNAGVPGRFALRLEREADGAQVRYYPESALLDPDQRSAYKIPKDAPSWPLLNLPPLSEFRYVDGAGKRHRQWPAPGSLNNQQPRAILIVQGESQPLQLLHWIDVPGKRHYPQAADDLLKPGGF